MPVIAPETMSERGKADARRHREKQKEILKERLPHIIAEESIITGKPGKVIRVPIRNLQIPEFKHKRSDGGAGVGQGKGGVGDIIGRQPAHGGKEPGAPGQEPGVDYIETEIAVEELIEMMLEDVGLPRLEEKNIKKLVVEAGWRIHGTSHAGPEARRDRRKTAKEGMRRFWAYLETLRHETKRAKTDCYKALKRAGGILPEALRILQENAAPFPEEPFRDEDIAPFPIITPDDMRFHDLTKKVALKSQACVIAMRDISGSMTAEKRYLSVALLFWFVSVLRQIFEQVEIRFIVHHTTARLVDEYEFFHAGETGGTECHTAYELANSLVESEYARSQWNTYVWHFSDGEDFSPEKTVSELKKLFLKGINMFGYGEIQPEGGQSSFPVLLKAFTKEFALEDFDEEDGFKVVASTDERHPLLAVVVEKKEHILSAIKAFLKRDRWQK